MEQEQPKGGFGFITSILEIIKTGWNKYQIHRHKKRQLYAEITHEDIVLISQCLQSNNAWQPMKAYPRYLEYRYKGVVEQVWDFEYRERDYSYPQRNRCRINPTLFKFFKKTFKKYGQHKL
jgi:hypothetical protein